MKRLAMLFVLLFAASQAGAGNGLDAVPELPFRILEKRAHDAMLFTQGMAFHGEQLVESGGTYGESRLLERTLAERSPVHALRLPEAWFAEGIAVLGDRLVMLTWREGIAQEYALPALQPLRRFRYRGEGWGLTSDGTSLVQSDGSARLVWRDPKDFASQRSLDVRAGGKPLERLNELEWVEGWLLANVWTTDFIVLIDPQSGEVRAKLALAGLLSAKERAAAEMLNGIAWHAPTQTLWVSGKNWPWLFGLAVEFPPLPPPCVKSGVASGPPPGTDRCD